MGTRNVNGVYSMRQLWHANRSVRMQDARLSISSPRLRAPTPDLKPKPRSSEAVARIRRVPFKQNKSDPQKHSDWSLAFLGAAKKWKSSWQAWYVGSLSHRLTVYGIVVFVSGTTIVCFFALERVPITGRRRFSWLSQSSLTKLDETERERLNELRENERFFIKSDYPGLRKIEAVFNRLVKASGLDKIAWEVRVIDDPSRLSPKSTHLLISWATNYTEINACYRTDVITDQDNAWIYRSGLVLITTGFFHHVISNDDELAAILGHEVAHLIARHHLEIECIRLADKWFTKPFAWLAMLSAISAEFVLFLAPIIASSLTSLALSRVREREADYIGLLLMVDAGFDPRGAVTVWTRFNEWEEEQQRRTKRRIRQEPQFRSTHPHVSLHQLFHVI